MSTNHTCIDLNNKPTGLTCAACRAEPIEALINMFEAMHPVRVQDPNLGLIDTPALIADARAALAALTDDDDADLKGGRA